MKFIIGKKIEMSQRYRPTGEVVPVTMVKVEPCMVTQVRSVDKDGYVAVQVGSGIAKRINKPKAGHLGKLGQLRHLREFRVASTEGMEVGRRCDIGSFEPGDSVNVVGTSKGKGFQGVVKRHGFHGSPASHGHKDQLRMPGSIGSTGPQRVFKGTRMGGHMGNDRVTVKNLEVVEVDAEGGRLAIKGAVPGARGSLVLISAEGEMKFIEEASKKTQESSETSEGTKAEDADILKASESEDASADEGKIEEKEKAPTATEGASESAPASEQDASGASEEKKAE